MTIIYYWTFQLMNFDIIFLQRVKGNNYSYWRIKHWSGFNNIIADNISDVFNSNVEIIIEILTPELEEMASDEEANTTQSDEVKNN